MKRETFCLGFVCRESKKNRKGLASVELTIVINGRRAYVSLPRKEVPSEFRKALDSKRGNAIKDYCEAVRRRIQDFTTEVICEGKAVTVEAIKDFVLNGYSNGYTVGMLINDYLSELSVRVDISLSFAVYRKYERILPVLYRFVTPESNVNAITVGVMEDVRKYLCDTYENSTAVGMLTKIKACVKYAFNKGKMRTNVCAGVSIKKKEKFVETLTADEYLVLRDKALVGRLEKSRDLFVFCCNTGLSYCDVLEFKEEDIIVSGGRQMIVRERNKTGVPYYAVILEDGLKILSKYDWDLSQLFISNQRQNGFLKEIADICGIKTNLTCHKARHYYACKLINDGIPIDIVSKCLGHTNTRITTHYARLLKQNVIKFVAEAFRTVV